MLGVERTHAARLNSNEHREGVAQSCPRAVFVRVPQASGAVFLPMCTRTGRLHDVS